MEGTCHLLVEGRRLHRCARLSSGDAREDGPVITFVGGTLSGTQHTAGGGPATAGQPPAPSQGQPAPPALHCTACFSGPWMPVDDKRTEEILLV